jgi:steroid Delta-isomerase
MMIEDLVASYYEKVDRQDIAGVISLFHPRALYERPGYPQLVGRDRLTRFYESERVITSGSHTITACVVQGCEAAVQGEFDGVLKSGDHATLKFADFFTVDDGLITARRTYFFAPMV